MVNRDREMVIGAIELVVCAMEMVNRATEMVVFVIVTDRHRSSSKIIDYTIDNNSSDEDSDEENIENSISDVLNDEDQLSPNNTDDEEEEQDNVIATDVPHAVQNKFNGRRIYDKINPQQSKKYFRIRIGSSYKFIHKQTSCWLLTTDKQRLSSDRLIRVRKKELK
ncbi:unnamed protein product [Rotaria magnacalcarata]|uniref:Uncharacterized protein n=1 Tax=Rotaria magnacalcarata TaxID=392030 RepID=A0A816M9Y3_9BILA|nr:unnamed protein product [Rotaria magnacalcarata]CAF1684422.1 unnamed protein product [Rotaria magnacalcarata]CAF1967528.1 unnamed protein product [Rotaria magnacalcarata]CAF4197689.1 unnamed protein product [Rotaria magnacalcarata]